MVAGEYGKQWSLGMQYDRDSSDDRPPPAEPTAGEMMAVATIKHVLGYSLEQWSPDGNWSEDKYDRINFDSVINPQDMEETYTKRKYDSSRLCINYFKCPSLLVRTKFSMNRFVKL